MNIRQINEYREPYVGYFTVIPHSYYTIHRGLVNNQLLLCNNNQPICNHVCPENQRTPAQLY